MPLLVSGIVAFAAATFDSWRPLITLVNKKS
jgi:hypothetical protein